MNSYLVMDGRAHTDMDSAAVYETFGAVNHKAAKKYVNRNYQGEDVCLVDSETNQIIYL